MLLCIHMLDRRTQILLDDERYELLRRRAEETGASISSLIREAVDRMLAGDVEARQRAAASFLAAEPMALPDWPELETEIETLYERLENVGT